MSAAPSRPTASVDWRVHTARKARLLLNDNTLTAAAMVQLVAGVITSKLAATLLGAAGVGTYALVQAVANIVALCALGTGEALVRETGRRRSPVASAPSQPAVASPTDGSAPAPASARSQPAGGSAEFGAMLRGAELAALASLSAVAVAVLAFNRQLARLLFGSGDGGRELLLLAVAAGITFGWVTLQVNSMVAQRRVRRVSLALALGAASTPVVALIGFRAWGVGGIGRVHLMAMLASLLTTGVVAWGRTSTTAPTSSFRTSIAEIPALLRYGVPHVLGTLFTASMLLIVPVVVAARQGVDAAGFYRAAATVAAGMATLFTFELNGDFSARIAEAATDRRAFTAAIGVHLRRLLVRGVLVVGALSVAAPVIVPVLYDRGFEPTAQVLPLILVGQLLGLVAMTLNIAVGARHGGGWMLLNATIGGLATVVAVAVVESLLAVGFMFVVGQAVFLVVCALSILSRDRYRESHDRVVATDG